MKFLSKHRVSFLNVLTIVFMMNTMLAHSNCFVDVSPVEQDSSAQINMSDRAMPCHTQDNNQAEESIKKDCCSVCSVFVLIPDRVQPIIATHAVMIDVPVFSFIARTLEIPFRPPINHLS